MKLDFIKKNLLPISIFVSAVMISSTLVFYGLSNRYEYIKDSIPLFDKLTGTAYYFSPPASFVKVTKKDLSNIAEEQLTKKEQKNED